MLLLNSRDRWLPNEKDRSSERNDDMALLANCFWPRADSSKVPTMAKLLVWFLFWDGEIDSVALYNSIALVRSNAAKTRLHI